MASCLEGLKPYGPLGCALSSRWSDNSLPVDLLSLCQRRNSLRYPLALISYLFDTPPNIIPPLPRQFPIVVILLRPPDGQSSITPT